MKEVLKMKAAIEELSTVPRDHPKYEFTRGMIDMTKVSLAERIMELIDDSTNGDGTGFVIDVHA